MSLHAEKRIDDLEEKLKLFGDVLDCCLIATQSLIHEFNRFREIVEPVQGFEMMDEFLDLNKFKDKIKENEQWCNSNLDNIQTICDAFGKEKKSA